MGLFGKGGDVTKFLNSPGFQDFAKGMGAASATLNGDTGAFGQLQRQKQMANPPYGGPLEFDPLLYLRAKGGLLNIEQKAFEEMMAKLRALENERLGRSGNHEPSGAGSYRSPIMAARDYRQA